MTRSTLIIACVLVGMLPTTAAALDLTLSAGVKGGLSGTAVRGVPEGDPYEINGQEYFEPQGPDLYAMFGLGGGVGGFFELRLANIVGLEFGVFQSWDNGNGWEDKNAPNGQTLGRLTHEQRTRALHVPILAKASVPGLIRPTFGLGVELVFQQKSTFDFRSDTIIVAPYNQRYTIVPSNYALFAFTFGVEVDLGPVRVPIELRGGYNVGFKKGLKERAVASGSPLGANFEYNGEYEGHFGIFTGIVYEYDIEL